jgi:hypothetical protein
MVLTKVFALVITAIHKVILLSLLLTCIYSLLILPMMTTERMMMMMKITLMVTTLMTTLTLLINKTKKKKKKKEEEGKLMRICIKGSASAHQIVVNGAPVLTVRVVVLLETFVPNATKIE